MLVDRLTDQLQADLIAVAGLLLLPGAGLDRDMVVLALPLAQGFEWLADRKSVV